MRRGSILATSGFLPLGALLEITTLREPKDCELELLAQGYLLPRSSRIGCSALLPPTVIESIFHSFVFGFIGLRQHGYDPERPTEPRQRELKSRKCIARERIRRCVSTTAKLRRHDIRGSNISRPCYAASSSRPKPMLLAPTGYAASRSMTLEYS